MEDQSVVVLIVLPVALAVIMVSLGLSLVPNDFRRVFVNPRGVGIGLANLLLISPLLAFGMAEAFGLAPALAVGLVLLGASPGGTLANLLTHLARGEVALSVSMTAISSLAAVITVPLYLSLAIEHFGTAFDSDVDMLRVVARVFFISIVPLAVGMWIRSRAPDWTARNYDGFRKAALIAFVLAVIAAVASEYETVVDNLAEVAVAAIALNLAAMTVSFLIARGAGLDNRQTTAIAMELGVHNATLAIAVGATIATELVIPAAVYSTFMFISAGLFARLMYHRNAAVQPA
ncbi:MAG: bile acid:sodium symporter family protein [Solirubrobacterales bacterium]